MKKLLAVLAAVLGIPALASGQSGTVVVLPSTSITVAVTGAVGPTTLLLGTYTSEHKASYLAIRATFTYVGTGGTNATAYVQTSLDEGQTWADIMSFQFTTATASKVSAVSTAVALTAATTTTDGALTANTIVNGLLGDRVRVKYTTTGTYAGTKASGTAVYVDATNPTAGKTVTVGTAVYTFVGTVAVAGDVKIGANADATATNLSRAINNSGGTPGAGNDYIAWDYGSGPTANTDASASINTGTDTVTLTAVANGVDGNGVPLASDESTITLSGAALAGGVSTTLILTGVIR
jgi:hypothetical protein